MGECVAVIPARGGSKGLPGKNLKTVGGVPLVATSIRAALGAERIQRVFVSTDDERIAQCARAFGAEVIDRPLALSGDTASSESALAHALDVMRRTEGYEPDTVVMLQCTSPLTSSADLDGLIEHMEREGADSAFTASPFFHFLWREGPDGVEAINHEGKRRQRRQDMAPQFLENGAAYAMRAELFLTSGERFCGKVSLFPVDASRTLEVDEPVDLVVANALVATEGFLGTSLPSTVKAVVFDFDGVFTDNTVLVMQDGSEAVLCNRGDGMGLSRLRDSGVRLLILSKERNPVVLRRAEKLGIECHHAMDDKRSFLQAWLEEHCISRDETIYVGNDINDLECMDFVGCSVAPADAHPRAKAVATVVLRGGGGRGAVRELCDLLL